MRKYKTIKKPITKTIISFLMAFVVTAAFIPQNVFADDSFTDSYGHYAEWWNYRNTSTNNAVTGRPAPTSDKETWEKWAVKFGSGFNASPTPPVIVDDKLYIGVETAILEIDKETGELLRTSDELPGSVGYAMYSPVYAEGKIFINITNGRMCAVNIDDMSLAWTTDNENIIKGQTVSPISYVNIDGTGYVYTGTWTKDGGTFFCASADDSDVSVVTDAEGTESRIKNLKWFFNPHEDDKENLEKTGSVALGYYWTGAYVTDKYLAVGSDNGSSTDSAVSDTAYYTINPETGEIIDAIYGIKGQVRSTTVYAGGYLYFSTRGAKIYKIPVDENGHLGEAAFIDLTEFGAVSSTATPVVYGGKIYLGTYGKGGKFSSSGGHGFVVVRDDPVLGNDSFLYNISVPGYPQAGALLSDYYKNEDFDGDGLADGRVYLYFTYNAQPGGIYYTYDTPDQTQPVSLTTEESKIFIPGNGKQQFCISPVVVDEDGTLYYKNDSCYLFAVESNPAALYGLTVYDEGGNALNFDKTFMAKISEYSLKVSSDVNKVRIVPDYPKGADVYVNGEPYTEGGVSVDLSDDSTDIQVVCSKNGKTRTYYLTVTMESNNAYLKALGSAKGNSVPSDKNKNTRLITPELQKEVSDYTFNWITTGTGDNDDPAESAMMNIFLTPESENASVKVWPGDNIQNTGLNEDGSVKMYTASGDYAYRYPVYSANITRDSTARIVVTAGDGVTTEEYNIVFLRRVLVTDVLLGAEELTLNPDDEYTFSASAVPDNATDKSIVWSSSDSTVAVVDEGGTVTALKEGETVIKAEAEDGTVSAECKVSVIEAGGHKISFVPEKEAECETAGYRAHYYCRTCGRCFEDEAGEKIVNADELVIPATGHAWGEYAVQTPAGISSDGLSVRICENCGKTDTVIIPGVQVKISGKQFTFNSKVQKPAAAVTDSAGYTLKEGTDYTIKYSNSNSKSAGKYTLTVELKGNYAGTCKTEYNIAKASNPLKVKVSKKSYRKSGINKKKASFKIGASKGQGKVTYTLSKAAKKAKIKVTKKGEVIIPKKCRKGTYKITVKAAGNANYNAGKKVVTIKVK